MTSRVTPALTLLVATGAAIACAAAVRSAPTTSPTMQQQERVPLANANDVAYAVGFMLGEEVRLGLEDDGVQVDNARIVEGFTAAINGQDSDLDESAMNDALAAAHDAVQARRTAKRLESDEAFKELYDRNLARSNAFHESFENQPGSVTLPSGAQYRVMESGGGDAEPVGEDATVVVTFRGALLDGRVFSEGESVELSLRDLTPGVRELLSSMRPGDWWQLAVPPALAYGGYGNPEMGIGPNETLIGDVKLLEVR
jgi:FKBP-type peptidyl-prolyl cis-trans isomerase FklB